MQQNFDVLGLVQVLNPLYALPIVAVILCAFLVYAFGFKSPVQPPSFDELIEVDKKQTKKRKVKENQKGKQQNGKVSTTVVKTSDAVGSSNKKKVDKVTGKNEAKVVTKKSSGVEKRRKNANQLSSPVIEDTNDEGWVHLVSKKGRKNKKKEDICPAADVSQPLMTHDDIPAIETLHRLQSNSNKLEDAIMNGSKETVNIVNVKNHIVEKVTDIQSKVIGKQNAPRKQRVKGKNELVTDSGKSLAHDTKVDEQVCTNGTVHPNNVESESSELESSATSDHVKAVKEQKQSKKKKKKKHGAEENENLDDVISSNIFAAEEPVPKFPSNKTVGSGLSVINSHEVSVSDTAVSESERGSGEKRSSIIDESKGVKKSEGCDGKGSNVAFDELEGLYPDAKIAKKKRKVRRDL